MNRISGHVGDGAGGLGLDSLQIAAHHPVLADQQAVLVAQIEIETAHSKRFQSPPEH